MIGYKLFTLRTDGSIGPLFINRAQRVPVGKWLDAECIPTKGFKVNRGWHLCVKPEAPHLNLTLASGERRVWAMVEYGDDYRRRNRPASQGGDWVLADRMRVLEVLPHLKGVTKP